MVEPLMWFGIGFLIATLIALIFIPLVHDRAVRLAVRRIKDAAPLSMVEIQADKDQLRAEYAVSTRRLEISIQRLKAQTTSQLVQIARKTGAINQLKSELGEKASAIFALAERENMLRDRLGALDAKPLLIH